MLTNATLFILKERIFLKIISYHQIVNSECKIHFVIFRLVNVTMIIHCKLTTKAPNQKEINRKKLKLSILQVKIP